MLGEPSKTLTRTDGSRIVGSSSQIDILKSRGRLTLLQTPYVLELLEGPMWEVVAVLYGYLSFEAQRYIIVLDR
jgi:hypothetical protein